MRWTLICLAACTGGRTGLGTHPAQDGEAPASLPIACGSATCDGTIEYCKLVVGGPPPGIHKETCTPLGGCHDCACLSQPRECRCKESGGIHVECDVP
jgi:hypothetical protein